MKLRAMLVGLAVAMCGAAASNGVHNAFSASDSLVAAYSFDEGSGTLRRRCLGQRQRRSRLRRHVDDIRQEQGCPHVRRRERLGHRARLGIARPQHRHDARGLGPPHRQRRLAHRRRQGEQRRNRLRAAREPGRFEAGRAGEHRRRAGRSGPSPLPQNAWSHIATTYDGTTVRLYVNGVVAGTSTISGSMPASSGPLRLGGNSIWTEWFRGQIDDVRIYNRALHRGEIQSDMNIGVGTAPTAPAGDAQAPTAPGGLTVSGQTQTALTLGWAASNDNVRSSRATASTGTVSPPARPRPHCAPTRSRA